MGNVVALLLAIFGSLAAVAAAIVAVVLFTRFIWAFVMHVGRFIGGMVGDTFRAMGAVIVAALLIPMILGSIVVGRWSATGHFGRALQNELATFGTCLYRVAVGHPVRLFGLSSFTEGLERRLPQIVAEAPGPDKPSRALGSFEGYEIIGSLPGGGSGAKLYIAKPNALKLAAFQRQGLPQVDRVVIKSFSLSEGSSLSDIVREGRALDPAKKLGLVLEHELTDKRFHYVMRYVPGDSLSAIGSRLHGQAGPLGLGDGELTTVMGFADDLLRTLRVYHAGGLWHKDVKPDNVIVDRTDGKAHLVDFGLVTPLHSAMTLTTHGTEYFRDPELVRLALKGVKVSQVDGTRFDIYGVGAVLYQLVENSFPAHGGLSQITRRCPDALKWIIRRAMTDYEKRYASVDQMLADVDLLRTSKDPFAVTPASLPSMRDSSELPAEAQAPATGPTLASATDSSERRGTTPPRRRGLFAEIHTGGERPIVIDADAIKSKAREWFGMEAGQPKDEVKPEDGVGKDKVRVKDWWRGTFEYVSGGAAGAKNAAGAQAKPQTGGHARPSTFGHPLGLSAAEQLRSAQARAAEARNRAQQRMRTRRAHAARSPQPSDRLSGLKVQRFRHATKGNGAWGVFFALLVFAAACAGGLSMVFYSMGSGRELIAAPRPTDAVQDLAVVPPTRGLHIELAMDNDASAGHGPSTGQAPSVSQAPVFSDRAAAPAATENAVLVTWTNRASWPEPVARRVDDALGRLAALGYPILGPAGDESSLRLLSEVRARLGTRSFGSEQAREQIVQWLGEHEHILAVVWIDRPEGSQSPRAWAIGRPALDAHHFQRITRSVGGNVR